jgi:hypothetical protein
MPDKETKGRKYLTDANYFRLGYQLAAQLMHREKSGEKKGGLFESADAILYGDPKHPDPYRFDSRRQAERFLEEAENVLKGFRERRKKRRLLIFRPKLEVKEERLEHFLCRTVTPSLTILIAASIRPGNPAEAEAKVEPVRKRANLERDSNVEKEKAVSYRTLYNLGCYEAGQAEDRGRNAALRYLAAALDRAPGSRRRELGSWASKDPSLTPLEDDETFKELLAPYA